MDQPRNTDQSVADGGEREPYEAPEVRTLASVEDATLANAEQGQDAMSFGGST